MSSVGSFGTFTTARLGIYAAQKGLSVTGNNIANINTLGYTRQRLDQVSFKAGGADRYQSQLDVRVGNGVLCTSVSQLRDPYLDIRYRTESASVGYQNAKLNGLNQIANVLDEIGKGEDESEGDGLIYAQFSDLFSSLSALTTDAGTEVNDTLVYASADILTDLFHAAAKELETQRVNLEDQLRQNVDDINSILASIRDLNESIRKSDIHGDAALEMRDDRNLLIDQLSEYIKIDVTYSEEDIGAGQTVEKLTIRLGNANPDTDVKTDSAILVDGLYATQLTTPKANDAYDPLYDVNSAEYKNAVKALGNGETVTALDGTEFTSLDDLQAAIDAADDTIKCAYLDENGYPTSDPRDALQEFDSQYNITLDRLLDANGKEWEDVAKPITRPLTADEMADFPTNAKYTATLKVDGTWKAGDKITIGGTTLEVGKDITVDNANTPKQLAAAIRSAIAGQDAFKDYSVSTSTTSTSTGCSIQLTLTAKEAGPQVTDPGFSISANAAQLTAGSATVGAATQDADNTNRFTAAVTVDSKFNEGDTITAGNVTLVVGKDISLTSANNAERLASAIANQLEVTGYKVSASKGSLVFTDTDGTHGTPTVPNITATAATPADVTASNGTFTPGKDGTPADIADPTTEGPYDNEDGTFTTVRTSYFQQEGQWYEVTTTTRTSGIVTLDDNDLYGALQANRELLTEEGEFASLDDIAYDESATIKRGIPYYQKCLDLLARQFANTFNEANTGYAVDQDGNYLDKSGNVLELAGEPVNKISGLTDDQKQALIDDGCVLEDGATPDLERWLDAKDADKMGGPLFSNRGDNDDPTNITAANISVSKSWSSGDLHVVTTFTKLFGGEVSNTTQNDNVRHMLTLMQSDLVYNPQDLDPDAASEHMFEGSFQEMLVKMSSILGNDQRAASTSLETHYNEALEIDTSRDSVSAVDLNDEAMNMMQYAHALNAAFRLMTTIDEALERLINNTGVT